ncbi:protein-L-isoaspartate(D-aspartate) O-methyltransferase [Candidatus Methylomicrobium oryzae]|jgi:protein-L-isoaspartate(D-aspartate) O-methyltransferase|uniref:protein-L-isoaspartate(D-aspartate) O-methyltransferase n=1 Tax=Candidatus Methylomicrobium oryzae TaxID=2802053 RepID=UPI001924108A|nr:protein-L-isoaspartate(D-aspartate) O-methyltransferase [Methylomicrobium sp. RS1]MBL1262303.1 protein-L-isoaspartate(D-aspartate) O-methyltransferase [Methylomicrobium sp. RS1]
MIYPTCVRTAILLFFFAGFARAETDAYARQRAAMVAEIEANMAQTAGLLGRKGLSAEVADALRTVPRHQFVEEEMQPYAYQNRPLPIGHGQTISQPYIVAVMTELLDAKPGDKVLEIGTGSAYQAAVLGAIGAEVFTIEIVEPLAAAAHERIAKLGLANIHTRTGDGYYGWPEAAPFDAVLVTAAASHIPPPLIKQLKPGGRMLIPVGDRFNVQQLVLVEKDPDQKVKTRQLLPVSFVPLTGTHQ